MLVSTRTLTKVPLALNPVSMHAGVSSLFAAAVVSRSFCNLLLADPEAALKQGYNGTSFGLNADDAALIVSLNAKSLPDLAQQVVQTLGM
jgi:hypothetical protein